MKEYENNKFEKLLEIEKIKIEFEEAYNNLIEVIIKRSNHKFIISVDEQKIICLMDEEADKPIEQIIFLGNIANIDSFYEVITCFISTHL